MILDVAKELTPAPDSATYFCNCEIGQAGDVQVDGKRQAVEVSEDRAGVQDLRYGLAVAIGTARIRVPLSASAQQQIRGSSSKGGNIRDHATRAQGSFLTMQDVVRTANVERVSFAPRHISQISIKIYSLRESRLSSDCSWCQLDGGWPW